MLRAIFTLDYEIHGNGDGSPYDLMVEPTRRMLDQFDRYGAKLTILADVAEILRFKEYFEQTGRDDFHYIAIKNQLQDAIRRGHDVQLHIHSSYFNARHENGHWKQDWSEYNFAGLPLERAKEMIGLSKEYLESILRPIDPSYSCFVFRAANWSMSPSANPIRALIENGFTIDTSVFKFGSRSGLVTFDYTDAPSNVVPWRVSDDDICKASPTGKLIEFPIYSENRWIGAFLTPNRFYRALLSRLHRTSPEDFPEPESAGDPVASARHVNFLKQQFAWKADFNQCGGRQLVAALLRAEAGVAGSDSGSFPFVLIGHSKLFTRYNEWSIRSFLKFVAENSPRFKFGKFADFTLHRELLPAGVSGADRIC